MKDKLCEINWKLIVIQDLARSHPQTCDGNLKLTCPIKGILWEI